MSGETTDSWGDFWGNLSDRVWRYLDYQIDDALGMYDGGMYGPPQYPESTPPSTENPTEPGFTLGNNAGTWALGLGVVALAALVAYGVKK